MLIELIGPSGVGKTTSLRALEAKQPSDGALWIGPAQIENLSKNVSVDTRASLDENLPDGFLEGCLTIVARARMHPSQKFRALALLTKTCNQYTAMTQLDVGKTVVYDELLLHRAFSFLIHCQDFEETARWFFENAPAPNAVIVARCSPEDLLRRVKSRQSMPNCYYGLAEETLSAALDKALDLADLAADTLEARGVDTYRLDTSGSPERTNQILHGIVRKALNMTPDTAETLKSRIFDASDSFRKKTGRHIVSTPGLAYCSFSTSALTIHRHEARRDAAHRLDAFGLSEDVLTGKTALDLGCNAGAMLFEMTNRGLGRGLGLEFDQDKIILAREIAALSGLENLAFKTADIDTLNADDIGQFDFVMALAIEGHVNHPTRLYRLLGALTRETLFFEGNGGCDTEMVSNQLRDAGFASIEMLGFCTDDSSAHFNNRPMMVAHKSSAKDVSGL